MPWLLTDTVDAFLAAAGDHLRADPARQTLPLTVLETLRKAGPSTFGDSPPVFGWHDSGSGIADGAFLQTPPFPVLIASLPPGSAGSLVDMLAAWRPSPLAVNLAVRDELAVLAAWTSATGGGATIGRRSRLFKLGELVPPDPAPPGVARIADERDRELLVDWLTAFASESGGGHPEDAGRIVAEKLSHRGFTLWEAGGAPVALAGVTREVAGVVRVAPVYTLPAHRRGGYGGAVTTAVSQAALDSGATAVVLFTDQANPTSNALYQRLGYRPIEERVVLQLTTGDGPERDVTAAGGGPS